MKLCNSDVDLIATNVTGLSLVLSTHITQFILNSGVPLTTFEMQPLLPMTRRERSFLEEKHGRV